MAQIDLGKLKFQWKGNYADSTAYEVDDVVFDKGSTWVVTAGITTANTTDPEASSSFDRMVSGFNYRAAYNNSTTYYLNDLHLLLQEKIKKKNLESYLESMVNGQN